METKYCKICPMRSKCHMDNKPSDKEIKQMKKKQLKKQAMAENRTCASCFFHKSGKQGWLCYLYSVNCKSNNVCCQGWYHKIA